MDRQILPPSEEKAEIPSQSDSSVLDILYKSDHEDFVC